MEISFFLSTGVHPFGGFHERYHRIGVVAGEDGSCILTGIVTSILEHRGTD